LASQLQHKPAKMHSMQFEILHNASVTTEPGGCRVGRFGSASDL